MCDAISRCAYFESVALESRLAASSRSTKTPPVQEDICKRFCNFFLSRHGHSSAVTPSTGLRWERMRVAAAEGLF
jgi:hypothetical protein